DRRRRRRHRERRGARDRARRARGPSEHRGGGGEGSRQDGDGRPGRLRSRAPGVRGGPDAEEGIRLALLPHRRENRMKGIKGVVLAGGLGTRLSPLTRVTNKHLLPIYRKPMIYYPIEKLVRAGMTEIMVVTGGPFAVDF